MTQLLRSLASCLMIMCVSTVSFAQIQAVFPVRGEGGVVPEMTFEVLQNNGFSWFSAPDATRFKIEVVRIVGTSVITNDYQNITENNFSPPDFDRNFFVPGRYTWTVEIMDGPNAGVKTNSESFNIVDNNSIVPTPTPTQVPEGVPTPTPEPPPAVGMPEIQFVPDQRIALSEILDFEIRWDEPAFPQDTTFTYHIMVISPFTQPIANKVDLTETSFKPVGLTQTGEYKVYLQATDTQTGLKSLVNSQTFVVAFNVSRTPTPVPEVKSPDITQDGETNVMDIVQFIPAFRKQSTDEGFLSQMDYVPDGRIDQKDLLYFISLYKNQINQLQPEWLSVDVPSFNFTGNQCIMLDRSELDIVDNEYRFEFHEDNNCNLSMVNGGFTSEGQLTDGALFYFTEVVGAVNYEINIESEIFGDQPKYFLDTQKFPNKRTGGRAYFHLNGFTMLEEILNITVRPIYNDQSYGKTSEVLRVIVPQAIFEDDDE